MDSKDKMSRRGFLGVCGKFLLGMGLAPDLSKVIPEISHILTPETIDKDLDNDLNSNKHTENNTPKEINESISYEIKRIYEISPEFIKSKSYQSREEEISLQINNLLRKTYLLKEIPLELNLRDEADPEKSFLLESGRNKDNTYTCFFGEYALGGITTYRLLVIDYGGYGGSIYFSYMSNIKCAGWGVYIINTTLDKTTYLNDLNSLRKNLEHRIKTKE